MALILVIEDDADTRDFIATILHRFNHEARLAATAAGGLEMARDERPDAVLLDILLPDLPGTTVLERLRAARPDVPVIMMSAITDEAVARRTLSHGAFDYIRKPFDGERLMAVVDAALAGNAGR
jgi:DNA-binding response OmpR family regulator